FRLIGILGRAPASKASGVALSAVLLAALRGAAPIAHAAGALPNALYMDRMDRIGSCPSGPEASCVRTRSCVSGGAGKPAPSEAKGGLAGADTTGQDPAQMVLQPIGINVPIRSCARVRRPDRASR